MSRIDFGLRQQAERQAEKFGVFDAEDCGERRRVRANGADVPVLRSSPHGTVTRSPTTSA